MTYLWTISHVNGTETTVVAKTINTVIAFAINEHKHKRKTNIVKITREDQVIAVESKAAITYLNLYSVRLSDPEDNWKAKKLEDRKVSIFATDFESAIKETSSRYPGYVITEVVVKPDFEVIESVMIDGIPIPVARSARL